MTVALLDGDIIAFRAACVGEDENPFSPEGMTYDLKKAQEAADWLIRDWTRSAGCTTPAVAFSHEINFRYHVLQSYKHNRAGLSKPKLYSDVVEFIRKNFKVYEYKGLEGDDILGLIGTNNPKKYTIVSVDKDIQTIPGQIFIPGKHPIPRHQKRMMADYFWMTQVLTGDSADGYKGCPGIGEKKAEVILRPHIRSVDALWKAVVSTYESKGLTEEDALVQARVSRILRWGEYDFQTGEISLWHPTSPGSLTPNVSAKPCAESGTDPAPPSQTVAKQEDQNQAKSSRRRPPAPSTSSRKETRRTTRPKQSRKSTTSKKAS